MTNFNTFSIGVQRRHPSQPMAVVVTERLEDALTDEQRKARDKALEEAGQTPLVAEFNMQWMRQTKPALPYPELAEMLRGVINRAASHDPAHIYLLIDATGLGTPIMDFFRERLADAGALIITSLLTSNDRCDWGDDERGKYQVTVGKRWMLNRLQILIQTNRLKLPPESAIAREVMDDLLHPVLPEIDAANDSLLTGGFAVGRHDALLTALGLTVLETHRKVGVTAWMPNVGPRPRRPLQPLFPENSRWF